VAPTLILARIIPAATDAPEYAMSNGKTIAVDLMQAKRAYRNQDYLAAFNIYHRLGDTGHVDSQLMVAWMLLKGYGTTQDEEAAGAWYARSAALGSPQGSFFYGRYLMRLGQPKAARLHYLASAQAGFLPGIFLMGYTASRGLGTEVDLDEAYRYLTQAAKQGHLYAIRELGVLDLRGHRGVFWRLFGVVEFIAAVVGAFLLAHVSPDSIRLIA